MSKIEADTISSEIAAIIKQRLGKVPAIDLQIEKLRKLEHSVSALEVSVSEMKSSEKTSDELRQGLDMLNLSPIHLGIAEFIAGLQAVKARFSRQTINIGVSGAARMGKSTLLQAISGLRDEHIPTGATLPVTAVRSQIFHSNNQNQAVVHFHDFDSFKESVLDPYHQELEITDVPCSLEVFEKYKYPQPAALSPEKRELSSSITLLGTLKKMQAAVPTFRSLLTGKSQVISLSELYRYVAYPSPEQENTPNCERLYLAVKDVQIDCQFPYAQVGQLGIIDLPGLGELSANAEKHHVKGLKNDVDLVLLVKRPTTGKGYWGAEDGKAANLLDQVRKPIRNRKDFTFIVINNGGNDIPPDGVSHLKDSIRREANEGEDNKNFIVLDADAKSQESVYHEILRPVLLHLTQRLPSMDREVLDGATQIQAELFFHIKETLQEVKRLVAGSLTESADVDERLASDVKELHRDLAESFFGLLNDELYQNINSEAQCDEFIDSVNCVYDSICQKITNGLWYAKGQEGWCIDALRDMRVRQSSGYFAAQELNRIRVEIANEFHGLDIFFQERINTLWHQVSDVFSKRLGHVLEPDKTGRVALEALVEKLESCGTGSCPTLTKSIRDLLDLRLEYRTHLHPAVREHLDGLRHQRSDTETGNEQSDFIVDASKNGAAQLYARIKMASEEAAYKIKRAIIDAGQLPNLVIFAAFERFDDSFVRAGSSELELRRFAKAYKHEIWPSVYESLAQDTLRSKRLQQNIDAIHEQIVQFNI